MTRALDILTQLQSQLLMKTNKPELRPSEVEEMFGPGFVSQYIDRDDMEGVDVPNVDAADRTYTTHRTFVLPRGKKGGSNYLPFESALYEQDEDEDKKKKGEDLESDADMAAAAAEEATEEATGESDEEGAEPGMETGADLGDVGGDVRDIGGGIGDMRFGMGQEEEPKTAGELGRIYELKKIYSRLTSIESYLSDESSKELSEIRNYVSQSIELFEVVSSNFDSYKDKLDEIIIMYYKFITEVYDLVKNFYKKEASSGD